MKQRIAARPTRAPGRGPLPRNATKRVRIIKKVRIAGGVWKFISLDRIRGRYVWDSRTGYYFLEWWEGRRRRRELAGQTSSQAFEAQRRKRNELIGELVAGGKQLKPAEESGNATRIGDAISLFSDHVKAHSPAKPATAERYRRVLLQFDRILGKKKYVEAVSRADIDDYKLARSREVIEERSRSVSPATINFEMNVLRAFFYYLIHERGIQMENSCARFKALRAEKERLKRRPPTYIQEELDKLFSACNSEDRAMFATLLLTGFRKQEVANLTWEDINLKKGLIRIRAKGDFAPKDYEAGAPLADPVASTQVLNHLAASRRLQDVFASTSCSLPEEFITVTEMVSLSTSMPICFVLSVQGAPLCKG